MQDSMFVAELKVVIGNAKCLRTVDVSVFQALYTAVGKAICQMIMSLIKNLQL